MPERFSRLAANAISPADCMRFSSVRTFTRLMLTALHVRIFFRGVKRIL